MTLTRRAHGVATAWTASQAVPYSVSATAGDACLLFCENLAAIGSAPAGWTEIASGTDGEIYGKVFRKNTAYSGSDSQPVVTATGGSGGVAFIEHWYSDSSQDIDSAAQAAADTDSSSTAFSATGSSITSNTNDVLLGGLLVKTVSTMTGGPTGIALSQSGATLGSQTGNFGARLSGASPTNSLHYGTYHKVVTAGGTGAPAMVATSGAGGGNATGLALIVRLREVAPNVPPTADAGSNQTVSTGATVTLDGSASTDSDGTVTGYTWVQVSGTSVTLSSYTVAGPTFTAPGSAATLVFGLTVTDDDGATSTQDTVTITVTATDAANAGADQTVAAWDVVTLAGTGSAAGTWSQISGASVTLGGSGAVRTFVAAPSNTPGSTVARSFRYTVGSASDDMTVTTASGDLFFLTGSGLRAARLTF